MLSLQTPGSPIHHELLLFGLENACKIYDGSYLEPTFFPLLQQHGWERWIPDSAQVSRNSLNYNHPKISLPIHIDDKHWWVAVSQRIHSGWKFLPTWLYLCHLCEHTCSGRSKIQARAMYPSKYLGEIKVDRPWRTSPRDPRLRESSRTVHRLTTPRPAVRSKALRIMNRRSHLHPRPLSWEGKCMYICTNLSKQGGYVQGTKVLHVQETHATQRYLSIQ